MKPSCFKHGLSGKQLYWIWRGMFNRCNPNNIRERKNYYDRGIAVCEEWKDSTVFILWATTRHKPGLILDRIDNNKGYSPDNCRFVTPKQSRYNTRTQEIYEQSLAKFIDLYNKGLSIKEIAKILNVNPRTVSKYRRRLNLPINNERETKSLIPQMQEAFNNGDTIEDVCRRFGVHRSTLGKYAKLGLLVQSSSLVVRRINETLPKVQQAFNEGMTQAEAARVFKLSPASIQKYLNNGTLTHPNRQNIKRPNEQQL